MGNLDHHIGKEVNCVGKEGNHHQGKANQLGEKVIYLNMVGQNISKKSQPCGQDWAISVTICEKGN